MPRKKKFVPRPPERQFARFSENGDVAMISAVGNESAIESLNWYLNYWHNRKKLLQFTTSRYFIDESTIEALPVPVFVVMVGELKLPWLQDMPWEEFEKLFSNHGILKMMDGYDPTLTKSE